MYDTQQNTFVTKICPQCETEFTCRPRQKYCSVECRYSFSLSKNGERGYAIQIKRRYGMTLEQYTMMFKIQDGKCAICGRDNNGRKHDVRLCIDHDHNTNKVRGLLCYSCNTMLAKAGDKIELLLKAIEYLKCGGFCNGDL